MSQCFYVISSQIWSFLILGKRSTVRYRNSFGFRNVIVSAKEMIHSMQTQKKKNIFCRAKSFFCFCFHFPITTSCFHFHVFIQITLMLFRSHGASYAEIDLAGIILETIGCVWNIQERTLFLYKEIKNRTSNLTSSYLHGLFTTSGFGLVSDLRVANVAQYKTRRNPRAWIFYDSVCQPIQDYLKPS